MATAPRIAEIEQLRAFQRALLPRECPTCGHATVAAAFVPAAGQVLGGDFHDSVALPGRDVYFVGDVTGHGMPAALVMAMLFGALHEALRFTQHPCEVLSHLHEMLAEVGERAGGPRLFSATLWIGVLASDGTLVQASAGHPSPLLLRADGTCSPAPAPTVPPLGFAAPVECREDRLRLDPGDRLLLYTDGLLGEGGVPDLAARLEALRASSPDDVVHELVRTGAADDRTAVLVTYRGA